MGVWQFIQDQVLGMKWLNELIGKGLSLLSLDIGERVGGSIQFFLYDTLKITVLLCFLIFVISYIQSYFPPERSKRILGRFHGIGANIISALLGTILRHVGHKICRCAAIHKQLYDLRRGWQGFVPFAIVEAGVVDVIAIAVRIPRFIGIHRVLFLHALEGIFQPALGGIVMFDQNRLVTVHQIELVRYPNRTVAPAHAVLTDVSIAGRPSQCHSGNPQTHPRGSGCRPVGQSPPPWSNPRPSPRLW